MDPLNAVIDTFEGKSQRLQWLTPITIGYLYTITGVWWHFVLTVSAIGGARFSSDLGALVRDEDETYTGVIRRCMNAPLRGQVVIIVFYLPYAIAIVYAPYRLYMEFNHSNVILVGLASIYCGIAAVAAGKLSLPDI